VFDVSNPKTTKVTKTAFERFLNDTVPLSQEFIDKHGLKPYKRNTFYGSTLRRVEPETFNKLYKEWAQAVSITTTEDNIWET
jgi:hypothetical protein